jgi:hypothetical protein
LCHTDNAGTRRIGGLILLAALALNDAGLNESTSGRVDKTRILGGFHKSLPCPILLLW